MVLCHCGIKKEGSCWSWHYTEQHTRQLEKLMQNDSVPLTLEDVYCLMFNMRILQLQPAGGTLTTRRDKIKLIMTQLFAVSVNLHLMMMIFSGRSKTIIVRSHYLFPKHAPLEILFISSHFPLAGNTEQQTMTFYFLHIQ